MQRAFSAIELAARAQKPRDHGLTMMIDWGLGPAAQKDILTLSSEFIDIAKVAVGISGLISEENLKTKIATYQSHGVQPFPGGMFLELAHKQEKVDLYLQECRRVGYKLIEVSDNVVHFSRQERQTLIERAVQEYGLRVLGEVGSKHETTHLETLLSDIRDSLDAGAWKVLVEAAEFVSTQGFDDALVTSLLEEVDAEKLIFELPGKWIADVHAHEVYQMMIWLVENIDHVNIANVLPEDVLPLETLRTGIGVTLRL